MKHLIFVIFFLFAQNVNANWITLYKSQIFEAKLLLSSVSQERQKTQALIKLNFKERMFSDEVSSHVLILEHICGEKNYSIVEERFYGGIPNKSKEIDITDNSKKFKEYISKLFPYLLKQTCI